MQREKKIRALRHALNDEVTSKGNHELVFVCPKPDCASRMKDKAKLSVNVSTDRFHCWTCDFGGKTLVPLLRLGGETPELLEYIAELEESRGEKKEEPAKVYATPILPNEFKSLSRASRSPYYHQAMAYLASRGVRSEDILRLKLGYCEDGEYKLRIIFPSFDDRGDLNFFVGRTWLDGQRTYKHGDFCKDIIFNDYMIDWTKPIVITEGPFDALKAGENAIPLQGSSLRGDSKLFRKIVMSGVDVYFALDTDALKKQIRIIELFMLYGVSSWHVDLCGKKDVGVMSHDEFVSARSNASCVRSDLDVMKMRILA